MKLTKPRPHWEIHRDSSGKELFRIRREPSKPLRARLIYEDFACEWYKAFAWFPIKTGDGWTWWKPYYIKSWGFGFVDKFKTPPHPNSIGYWDHWPT